MGHRLDPWHWRSHPLEGRSGSDIFQALFIRATEKSSRERGTLAQPLRWKIATLLESPAGIPSDGSGQEKGNGRSPLARYSICAGAPRQLNGHPQLWTPQRGTVLPTLNTFLEMSRGTALNIPEALPFTGGWLGWLGYDVAWEVERLPSLNADPLPFPVAFWYVPDCFAVLDHWEQTVWLAATHPDDLVLMERTIQEEPQPQAGEIIAPTLSSLNSTGISRGEALPIHFVSNQDDYETAIIQAKKYIQAGDIFQANLSLRFSTQAPADSWSIYRALQSVNPSPFASYWQTPWGAVISCSPERLVQLQGSTAQTRPIAGTRPRGTTPDHDHALEHELLDNAKENAEHIMLVDLERNDLGRVCTWGSVNVDELLTIERYSHVMHLVSNVTGTVRSPYTPIDLIRALFPGGTITGCPKVRCMEIIEELEPVRRNLFYGSCGYLDCRGHLDLNILIRTLLYVPQTQTVWGQIGAGIVADSEPEREWHEALSKAQAQLAALSAVTNR